MQFNFNNKKKQYGNKSDTIYQLESLSLTTISYQTVYDMQMKYILLHTEWLNHDYQYFQLIQPFPLRKNRRKIALLTHFNMQNL